MQCGAEQQKGGRIQCRTDNAAVVKYRIRAILIPSRENGAANALSQNQVQLAEAQLSPLLEELLDMLVHRCPNWITLH